MLVMIILYALIFGGTTAMIANSKGREPFGWFFLGALFGIFALVAVIAMPALGRS